MFSGCRCVVMSLWPVMLQWQTDPQRRTLPGRTFDVQRAAYQARAFPQADEAIMPCADLQWIESRAIVTHFDVECLRVIDRAE